MYLYMRFALAGLAGVLTGAAPTYEAHQDNSVEGVEGFNSTAEAYAQRSYFYAGGQYVNASLVCTSVWWLQKRR